MNNLKVELLTSIKYSHRNFIRFKIQARNRQKSVYYVYFDGRVVNTWTTMARYTVFNENILSK